MLARHWKDSDVRTADGFTVEIGALARRAVNISSKRVVNRPEDPLALDNERKRNRAVSIAVHQVVVPSTGSRT